ncbi:MAG: SufE family protein [Aliihoeflea sp.]|uniref:SufE family protein n=1 Tax=Aliihoeflea sp. 40Bstr573 TaxID=2696467 RepID=UPI0020965F4D|nr:SufE family protein [Aliihoeflea sp. 40Bstr573]MCO6386012.1 cysteine desulfuration protein SufE [Aliihoeflea sp. 40Bstr573]
MSTSIDQIYEDFAFLDEWEDRYRYIIELGAGLPAYPEEARDAAHKVQGCVSQVWLNSTVSDGSDPKISFEGDSDSHIVKGLVAIVLALYSGRRASEMLSVDADAVLKRLGLDEHLTPQRANGLRSMIKRIRMEAASVSEATPAS